MYLDEVFDLFWFEKFILNMNKTRKKDILPLLRVQKTQIPVSLHLENLYW